MSSIRSKNFRRRSDRDDDEDDSPKSQTLITPKLPPKPKNPKPPSRLSFADDEEDDENGSGIQISVRKRTVHQTPKNPNSDSVHKLSSSKSRSEKTKVTSNVQPQAGEYTKERLLELHKNARTLSYKQETKAEPVVLLKGLIKLESNVVEKEGVVEEKKDMKGLSDMMSQADINAIKAKREQMRKARAPLPDFISLDGGGVVGSKKVLNDSDEEDDGEFTGRVGLFAEKSDGKVKKGVFEEIEDQVLVKSEKLEVDNDEEEEDRKWEEEQFRKGLGKRMDVIEEVSSFRGANSFNNVSSSALQTMMKTQTQPNIPHADTMTIAQKAEVATRALKDNIAKLKDSHKRTMDNLNRTDDSLSESLTDITSLEKSLELAGEKYVFMQQLRDFISITCDFLKDKALLIEELEEEMQKLNEKRAAAIAERRAADMNDESGEIEAAVKAAMSVLSKGSSSVYVPAARKAAQAALSAVRESSNLPVELDEFGRDVNLQKRMDITRRADARKKRRERAEFKRTSLIGKSGSFCQLEGEVTTDESDSESNAYNSTKDELLQTAEQIFSDASDEFANLSVVKEKLEKWKMQYPPSYGDAYMSLSLPAVFSPYVRLELLKWDPLYNRTDFDDMKWHEVLFNYGMQCNDQEIDPEDSDANLIPELVEKVALPILHHELKHCWDIFSTKQTKNAVFAVNLVITYVPASSRDLQELLSVVHSRLSQGIANLNVPVWSSVITDAVPGAAHYTAYRFGTTVRLLRNLCLWKDVLSLPILEKLAMEEVLKGKLLPYLRNTMSNIHDAITKLERIIDALSGVWYGPNVTSDNSTKLQPLIYCVTELGRGLEKRQASGVSAEETIGLARRLKNMLVQLNEYDLARAMLKTFHLKEAL